MKFEMVIVYVRHLQLVDPVNRDGGGVRNILQSWEGFNSTACTICNNVNHKTIIVLVQLSTFFPHIGSDCLLTKI